MGMGLQSGLFGGGTKDLDTLAQIIHKFRKKSKKMKTKLLHSYGKNDIAEYDWDKPEPTDDQIEVKAQLTGICRSDIGMVVGNFGPLPFGMFGHEGLGQVTKIGKNIDNGQRSAPRLKIGDYVATRSDAAYAYYYNATEKEYVKVPECDPKYILEPIACAINIANKVSYAMLEEANGIIIFGSGFLATIVHSYLKTMHKNICVVGNANDQYWDNQNVTRYKSIFQIHDEFKVIIDLSEKPTHFQHSNIVAENATIIQAAVKESPVQTDFSTYLWKNVTMLFPSPRDKKFNECMISAKSLIQYQKFDVSNLWTKGYARKDFEIAFADGIKRPFGYSRGYIDWRI